ncbi:hypothetical protein D9756_004604 [Leucocoprinus leucothites]|uniref:NACHT domain-containing protein n=1 Tax=Leucocoprinus leucothites TaxID=201217 RepID=A0A8H5GA26_9AGAR|nr:hypothetical protein D9756_004604 [Leucoagaricus leucothites]
MIYHTSNGTTYPKITEEIIALDLLIEHTIPGAEFDSYERDPPPQCHPGTRLDILERVRSWFCYPGRQHQILWLYGPAGVGKSAIMQTLAEEQSESLASIMGATIFFSRPNKRDDPRRLFTTIAYQLAINYPSYQRYVIEALTNDPRIIGKSIAEQFKWLIVRPFTSRGVLEDLPQTALIILDGLDECKDEETQRQVVLLVGRFTLKYPNTPLIWAIASRPEPHIRSAFSYPQILNCHWEISVPVNSDQGNADVERFLREQFQEIRLRYPTSFPSTTHAQWPAETEFLTILKAASGLFLFASVVIRFILDESYGNPVAQLRKVLTVIETIRCQEGSHSSPFAILDEMYSEILSAVPPDILPQTMRLLALSFYSVPELGYTMNYSLGVVCNWLEFGQADVYGTLQKLHSVLEIPPPGTMKSSTRLKAFHTSFPDYIASMLRGSYQGIDPRKEALTGSMRVLLESYDPRSTIETSRVKVSWIYANEANVQDDLFVASFTTLAPHVLEISSYGDGPSGSRLRSFFESIDYGKDLPRSGYGGWWYAWHLGKGRWPFLSALRSWGLARPFNLLSLDLNRVRPTGKAWALRLSPLSEPSMRSAPRFLHWDSHVDWKDQVSKHIASIANLEIPACLYLVGRGASSAVVMHEDVDSEEDNHEETHLIEKMSFLRTKRVEELRNRAHQLLILIGIQLAMLLDRLSNELLNKIIVLARVDNKKGIRDLRLVSKRFNELVSPVLFAKFRLYHAPADPAAGRFAGMRTTLTAGKSSIGPHIKTLEFRTHLGFTSSALDLGPWFDFFRVFIPALTNVSSVNWNLILTKRGHPPGNSYPPRGIEELMETLARLPCLQELSLELGGTGEHLQDDLPLESFAKLRTFNVRWDCKIRPHNRIVAQLSGVLARSPSLESFSFVVLRALYRSEKFGVPIMLDELFEGMLLSDVEMKLKSLETRGVIVSGESFRRHMRHSRCLEKLRIRFDPSPSAAANIGSVFQVLSSERIFLKSIHIDVIHHPLVFDYLSSYSGIELLALKPGHPQDNSLSLVDQFFSSVLPCHSVSLRSLRLGGNLKTVWSQALPVHHLMQISKCQLLEHICCWLWLEPEDAAAKNSESLVSAYLAQRRQKKLTQAETVVGCLFAASTLAQIQVSTCLPQAQRFQQSLGCEHSNPWWKLRGSG